MKKKNKNIISIIIIILIILATIGSICFLYLNSKKTKLKEETIFKDENIINQVSFKQANEDEQENIEGAIGYLTIESIGLINAPIKEGTDMETLNNYIGHFTDSNYLDGNVALAGHNRGYEKNYFENLKNLKGGELIVYQTKSETKTYKVTEIKKVEETNVEIIEPTKENKITLVTCVENVENLRLVITGSEI